MLTDWLNEECLEHRHFFCFCMQSRKSGRDLSIPHSVSQTEKEKKGEREWERERETEWKREGVSKRERERKKERDVKYGLFLFFKEWRVPWPFLVI
jgi:hypothetical protein